MSSRSIPRTFDRSTLKLLPRRTTGITPSAAQRRTEAGEDPHTFAACSALTSSDGKRFSIDRTASVRSATRRSRLASMRGASKRAEMVAVS